MRLLRSIVWTITIGAGLYFLFVLFLVLSPDMSNYLNRTEFDSARWKEWVETETEMSLRWDMIKDLEEEYQLQGMTEREIVELLGEPETKSRSEWTYYLGMARRGIDTGTLSLIFEGGRVKSYEVYAG